MHEVRGAASELLEAEQLAEGLFALRDTGWVKLDVLPCPRVTVTHMADAIYWRLYAAYRQTRVPCFELPRAISVAAPPGMEAHTFRSYLNILEERGHLELCIPGAGHDLFVRLMANDGDDFLDAGPRLPPLSQAAIAEICAEPAGAAATAAAAASDAAAAAAATAASVAASLDADRALSSSTAAAAVAAASAGAAGALGPVPPPVSPASAGAAAPEAGGAAGGYSAWARRMMARGKGKQWAADVRVQRAKRDLKIALRNALYARHYGASEDECPEPEADAELPAVPLPAGCVRIDEALGEVPPDIFGGPVRLEFPPRGRSRAARTRAAAESAASAERRATRLARRAERARVLQSRKRHLQPETREDVRGYHARRRMMTVPYDPYAVDAQPVQPAQPSLWRLLEEEGEAHRKARQEEALAAQFAERNKRQREDRGNTRAWQACTRARQEAVSLLSSPLAVMPPLVPEQPARPKRKCPGDDTPRGSKLARKGELGDA